MSQSQLDCKFSAVHDEPLVSYCCCFAAESVYLSDMSLVKITIPNRLPKMTV
jgi:hypothetical protein